MGEQKIELPEGMAVSITDQIRIRTPNFVRTYANSVAVGFSQWDMYLLFGDILGKQEEAGEQKTAIEETVQINLTREVAKALAGILLEKITQYESQFGEIKLPVTKKPEQPEASPVMESPAADADIDKD
jgi:Protein of unknown function (DUF3467)